ncbi:MAG TPA: lysophospholipid acyltransferase family protein [Pyrinomonadaceae bacterium]|jgi:KDO2-lipid IV(A) lauroyltransferase|nr:lysophospholipid acyltransferase family protein [Pyrinomonadaceae bacterium]
MAKPGKLQTFLEYSAAKTVIETLGRLPAPAAFAAGRAMGKLAYMLAGDLRRTGRINLQLAFPEKSEEERAQLLRETFDNFGRLLGFFSQMSSRSREELKQLIEVRGWENFEAAKAAHGDRLILFTGHIGAWELTSFGISMLGHPFTFLVRRLDNPRIEEMVDRVRTKFGNQTLDKLSAARSMLKILHSGETTLGLLTDLNTLDGEAIFIDFMGVPAATTFVVAKLAVRTKTPLVPVFAPWSEEKGKFLLIVEPFIPIETTGDEEADVRQLTIKLTQRIEERIRQYPGQWLWVHKRWKTRPPGEPPIY